MRRRRAAVTWQDLFDFGKLPLLVAQRAGGARLEPALNAVQVEDVPAAAPRDAQARVVRVPGGVCLRAARPRATYGAARFASDSKRTGPNPGLTV